MENAMDTAEETDLEMLENDIDSDNGMDMTEF